MQLDIRNIRTRWINVDKDVKKACMMKEMLDDLGFSDHARFSAITGIKPHKGVRAGEEHYRNCAESHFALLKETIVRDGAPVLILEDDVDIERPFTPVISVPDAADALYVGTSHGGYQYTTQGYRDGCVRIMGVLATHAILYFNRDYAKKVRKIGKKYIYRKKLPFDIALASEIQGDSRVCALHRPMFYQADAKNEKNKWEQLTRIPLILTDQWQIQQGT